MDEEGEWKIRPSRRDAFGEALVPDTISTTIGVAPRTAPSLRLERSRRERSLGSRLLTVGGGAGKSSTRKDVVVVDMMD